MGRIATVKDLESRRFDSQPLVRANSFSPSSSRSDEGLNLETSTF